MFLWFLNVKNSEAVHAKMSGKQASVKPETAKAQSLMYNFCDTKSLRSTDKNAVNKDSLRIMVEHWLSSRKQKYSFFVRS